MQSAPSNGSSPADGKARRAFPPDVWDRLKRKAEEAGGVGGGRMFESAPDRLQNDSTLEEAVAIDCPRCLIGLGIACGVLPARKNTLSIEGPRLFGGSWLHLDSAIDRARTRLGLPDGSRVPFEPVMAELGFERGGGYVETPAEAAAAEAIGDEEGGATDA